VRSAEDSHQLQYICTEELAMAASLADFRATMRLTWADPGAPGEKVFSYWNNQAVAPEECDRDEVLRIVRAADGGFSLEIANLQHRGSLEELECILYTWASDEGWFD
jgi:hypothetical protein